MALPFTFASLASATMSMLDSNFSALGALTPIPCSVSGTNALTLTPLANSPTVSSYQNYMMFSFIAGATSSGLMTAQVGSLASLKVYVDSSSGTAQASTGAVVQNTAAILMYDSTLDTGNGGFHIISTVTVGSYLPLAGGTLTGLLTGTTVALSGPLTAASATVTGQLKGATVTATGKVAAASVASTGGVSGTTLAMSGDATVVTASVTSLKIAGGNSATRLLYTSVTLAFGAIAPQSVNDQTVTLTGVRQLDTLSFGVPSAPTAGIAFMPFVSASDTIIFRAFNFATVTLTPPSGVYPVSALGFT